MKKFIYSSVFFVSSIIYSQNTFPTGVGTNVGIGITSPSTRLQITSATAGTSGVRLTNMTSATATTAGNSKALSVDASGNIILTPVVNNVSSDLSIYNNDGTLAANRTVTMNTRNLTFNPTASNSQFFINGTNGNVGLGTLTPSVRLDVNGFTRSKTLWATNTATSSTTYATAVDYFNNCNVIGAGFEMTNSNPVGTTRRMFNFYDLHSWSNQIAANDDLFIMNIIDRSNIERFTFYGNKAGGPSNGKSIFQINDKTGAEIFKLNDNGSNEIFLQMGNSNSKLIVGGYANYGIGHKLVVQNGSALIDGNVITNSNVGIGTTNFIDGVDTYRLSVSGAVRAHRVRVYTTWADYVFNKDYHLPSLEEVEQHIKDNGHLIDIPSAKEVETNGIELGEMNKLLLQKIEELTLYMIEMNKEITILKSQIKNN